VVERLFKASWLESEENLDFTNRLLLHRSVCYEFGNDIDIRSSLTVQQV